MDILNDFKQFIEGISKNDKIALFFDPDPDGICAGVLIFKAIEKLIGKKIDLILFQEHGDLKINEINIKKLKACNINKIFMADLAVDEFPEPIMEISNFAELCIFDHHAIYKNLNSEKILHIKPQMLDYPTPSAYVTAKLVYDSFSPYVDLSNYDWLAAIGIIGDAALKKWKDFVYGVCKKYDIEITNIFSSKLSSAMRLIAAAPEFGFNVIRECFDIVCLAEKMEDILDSSLIKYREIINKEMYKVLNDFKRNAERHGDLIFYEFNSKYTIGSTLSTRVSFREPNKTFIVIQENDGDYLKLSLRRQDFKVKVNELVAEAVKDLEDASGGGHIPAAGGRIKKKDLKKFKQRIMEILGKI
ncbi:MAG: DHHA1 domain-containing protein [Nanoarchaeota archaeon]|nr:DHHA1 domain-containing protein [Nanoarchaeota archaeon]